MTAPTQTWPPPQPAPVPVRRRGRAVIAVACVAVLLAAAGWYLAVRWHVRATRAEAEYREISGRLSTSEGDVSQLEERQRDLAAEKARIEDEKTAVDAEKQALEADRRDLAATLAVIERIAVSYRDCSAGYVEVIGDLDTQRVDAGTSAALAEANAACANADGLVATLQTPNR